jgi:biotin carboxylase
MWSLRWLATDMSAARWEVVGMTFDLGRGEVVLVGFSRILLFLLADELPVGCVVVVEEPDIARQRNLDLLAAEYPAVGRIVPWEYQRPGAMAGLIHAESSLKRARVVVPGVEYAVTAAANLAAVLGLPGAGEDAGTVFRDKVRQRRVAAAAGIRNPVSEVVDTAEAALAFFQRIGARCIIKPSARQASLGVRFVASPQEVTEGFRGACHARESLFAPSRGVASKVLIESAVEGIEYSVEMLLRDSRPCFYNVTAKHLLPGDFPVELGHVVPGLPKNDDLADRLVQQTALLATVTGFQDGILHCEWIVDEEGPIFVEGAARLAGDQIGRLITLAYDYPLGEAYLRIMLGEDPCALPVHAESGAAVRFVTARPGVIQEVLGLQEAERVPGVKLVNISVNIGDTVGPVTSSWDRAGYVIAHAGTPGEADASAQAAAALIQVRTQGR